MKSYDYLVTIVLHNQDNPLKPMIDFYEQSLQTRDLPDIPFHATPLIFLLAGFCLSILYHKLLRQNTANYSDKIAQITPIE